jgi:hypothetical protein
MLKKGGLAMCSALTTFPAIALFFLMAGVQMPVAIFFGDHCPEFDTNLRVQLSGRNISKATFDGTVELSGDVDGEQLFTYLTSCGGAEPELLTAFQDPDNLLRAAKINFTDEFTNVQYNKANVTLRNNTISLLDTLGSAQYRFYQTAQGLRGSIRCDQITPLWNEFRDELCWRIGGAFALGTVMYFVVGLCMIPGIIIGIRGYKRFDPENSTEKAEDPEDDQEVFDEYEFEGQQVDEFQAANSASCTAGETASMQLISRR